MPTATKKKTRKTSKAKATDVSGLAAISAEEFDSQSEKLAGQERTAKLQLAEKKVEGILIKGQEQDVKNAALSDRVEHAEAVRGVQAQTMAQKLEQENNSLRFATDETRLKAENFDIQRESLEAHNQFGRDMLATSKEMYDAKLAAAKAKVQNFIASSQAEANAVAGEVIDL